MKRLEGRIALVTGASRGIGAAVAKAYAAEGAHVVLAGRTVGALEEVDDAIQQAGGTATIVPIDLKDLEKIDQLAFSLAGRYGKLDILVGNAGVLGKLSPLTHTPDKIWNEVMQVNVNANFRLLRSMDPLLRKSDAGRAIFVTSGVTQNIFPYWGPYAISKTALETMVKTYAAEVSNTPIKVNLIDPGVVRTDMRASAMPGEDPMTLPEPATLAPLFIEAALPTLKKSGITLEAA
ncbi:MAG: SDR family NAD(P)-dependent oxidoreductase [Proteobacteria bacterium]|nr:SDR family NAD(P)-dependent oxidoreductase [Pseudomonadota bacterium]